MLIGLLISIITLLFIINFFLQIVATSKLQGIPIIISPVVGLFGIIIGEMDIKKGKSKLHTFGIIINSILIIFPFAYHILGTIIGGP